VPRGADYPCALTLDNFAWFKSVSTGAKVMANSLTFQRQADGFMAYSQ